VVFPLNAPPFSNRDNVILVHPVASATSASVFLMAARAMRAWTAVMRPIWVGRDGLLDKGKGRTYFEPAASD